MMSGYVFLLINGYELTAPDHEVVSIAEGMARKEYDAEDLENWLCHWARPYDSRELCVKPMMGICEVLKIRIDSSS